MRKHVLPAVLVSAVVLAGLYFFFDSNGRASGTQTSVTSQCQELTDEEIAAVVGGFMKKQGYDDYGIKSVGPIYCENGVGTRNLAVEATIGRGTPTQYNKTVRLQMRSAAGEMRIYEVVLTRPS